MKKLFIVFFIIIIGCCNMQCFTVFAADGSSKEQAIEIEELDTLYYGTLAKKEQKDWYKLVTGPEDAYYYCTFTNETGDEKVAHIYNERGTSWVLISSTYSGYRRTGNIRLAADSIYYICVSAYVPSVGGNYSFEMSKKVDDVGSERKAAMEIDMDTIYYQSIDGDGDEDWYCISTNSKAVDCSFYLKNESATSDLLMKVYNERDAELLSVWADTGEAGTKNMELEPDAKYYLRVYINSYGNTKGTGNYAFEISQCANGHTPSETWTTTLEPTCLLNGEKSKICSVCGKTVQTESIDALGHSLSETWTTVLEPTCLSNGEKRKTCSVCREVIQTENIEALGHNYINAEVVKEPTLTSLGRKKLTCSRCGDVSYSNDWSKAWILPLIIAGCLLALVGTINYIKVFSKAKR